MPNFERIATGLDVAPLLAALDAMPELWGEITLRQDYPGSVLTAGGEVQHFAPGEAWWFDHKVEHTADNLGESPRIHIIFDAVTARFPMPGGART